MGGDPANPHLDAEQLDDESARECGNCTAAQRSVPSESSPPDRLPNDNASAVQPTCRTGPRALADTIHVLHLASLVSGP